MTDVIKIIGIGLLALIIIVILKQYKPEFAIYVSMIAGVLILVLAIQKLTGIINLLQSLANKTYINKSFLSILLKITGIAFITEFAVSICSDAGEKAIASKIEIGSKVIIIAMSIPIITSLLELVIEILPWIKKIITIFAWQNLIIFQFRFEQEKRNEIKNEWININI